MPWDSVVLGVLDLREVLTALGFAVGGFLVGLVIGRLVVRRLEGVACRLGWEWCGALSRALHWMPEIWFTLFGIYLAGKAIPLEPSAMEPLTTGLVLVAIATVTWATARLVAALVAGYAARAEGVLPSMSIFTAVSIVFVGVIGFLVALQYLGISIAPILTALGVGGLAVALALQDTLANLFAGFQLIASRQLRPGDYVQVETGEEGTVVDITWRNTTIRTLTNNTVVVPNSKLAQNNFTNYHLPEPEMSVIVQVGIAYDSDLEQVERVALEVALETMEHVTGGQPVFDPLVRFHTFGDSSIDFNVILRVQEFVDGYLITHEFVKRLKRRFDREGIEIPFPIRTVRFPQGPSPEGWEAADAADRG